MFVRIGEGVVVNLDHVVSINGFEKGNTLGGFFGIGGKKVNHDGVMLSLDNHETVIFKKGTPPYDEVIEWIDTLDHINES